MGSHASRCAVAAFLLLSSGLGPSRASANDEHGCVLWSRLIFGDEGAQTGDQSHKSKCISWCINDAGCYGAAVRPGGDCWLNLCSRPSQRTSDTLSSSSSHLSITIGALTEQLYQGIREHGDSDWLQWHTFPWGRLHCMDACHGSEACYAADSSSATPASEGCRLLVDTSVPQTQGSATPGQHRPGLPLLWFLGRSTTPPRLLQTEAAVAPAGDDADDDDYAPDYIPEEPEDTGDDTVPEEDDPPSVAAEPPATTTPPVPTTPTPAPPAPTTPTTAPALPPAAPPVAVTPPPTADPPVAAEPPDPPLVPPPAADPPADPPPATPPPAEVVPPASDAPTDEVVAPPVADPPTAAPPVAVAPPPAVTPAPVPAPLTPSPPDTGIAPSLPGSPSPPPPGSPVPASPGDSPPADPDTPGERSPPYRPPPSGSDVTPSSSGGSESEGLSTGVIVAVAAGGVLLVLLVGIAACCICRPKRKHPRGSQMGATALKPASEASSMGPYYSAAHGGHASTASMAAAGYTGGKAVRPYGGTVSHRSKGSSYSDPAHTYTYAGAAESAMTHPSSLGYHSTGASSGAGAAAPSPLPWDAEHTRVPAPYGIDVPRAARTAVGTYVTDMEVAEPMEDTMAPQTERARLEAALDNLHYSGELFMGRLRMLSAQQRRGGGQGVVQFAQGAQDGQDYAVKFFLQREAFDQEHLLYSNPALRDMMPAVRYLESNADGAHRSRNGWPFPPCIVIERGESLDMWAKRIKPDFSTIMQVLCHVTERLRLLHAAGLAHRDLKPGNVLWRPKHLQWTLIDFGCAANIGSEALLMFSLRYAAPETVAARETGERTVVADAAVDMWALGVMAYELLTDTPLFSSERDSARSIMDRLTGREPLPWEDAWPDAEDRAAKLKQLRMLRRSILLCLSRDARARPTSDEVLEMWNRHFDYDEGGRTSMTRRTTGE